MFHPVRPTAPLDTSSSGKLDGSRSQVRWTLDSRLPEPSPCEEQCVWPFEFLLFNLFKLPHVTVSMFVVESTDDN